MFFGDSVGLLANKFLLLGYKITLTIQLEQQYLQD